MGVNVANHPSAVTFIVENLLLLLANGYNFFLHVLQVFDVIICSVSLYFEFNHGNSATVCSILSVFYFATKAIALRHVHVVWSVREPCVCYLCLCVRARVVVYLSLSLCVCVCARARACVRRGMHMHRACVLLEFGFPSMLTVHAFVLSFFLCLPLLASLALCV